MDLCEALDVLEEQATHAGWWRAPAGDPERADAAARHAREEQRQAVMTLCVALGMPMDRHDALTFLSTQPR